MVFSLLFNYGFPTENKYLLHRVYKEPKNKSRYKTRKKRGRVRILGEGSHQPFASSCYWMFSVEINKVIEKKEEHL